MNGESGHLSPEDRNFGLSVDELAEVGRLAIAAQQAAENAEDHRGRAEAEGWDNDPTGSGWLSASQRRADEAWGAFLAKLHEHGLTADYQHDSGAAR